MRETWVEKMKISNFVIPTSSPVCAGPHHTPLHIQPPAKRSGASTLFNPYEAADEAAKIPDVVRMMIRMLQEDFLRLWNFL